MPRFQMGAKCYCDLADATDIDRALALSGQELNGNEIFVSSVRAFIPEEEHKACREQQPNKNKKKKKGHHKGRGQGTEKGFLLTLNNFPDYKVHTVE